MVHGATTILLYIHNFYPQNSIILSVNHCEFLSQALLSTINFSVCTFDRLADQNRNWRSRGRSLIDNTLCDLCNWLNRSSLQQFMHATIMRRYHCITLPIVFRLMVRPTTGHAKQSCTRLYINVQTSTRRYQLVLRTLPFSQKDALIRLAT